MSDSKGLCGGLTNLLKKPGGMLMVVHGMVVWKTTMKVCGSKVVEEGLKVSYCGFSRWVASVEVK